MGAGVRVAIALGAGLLLSVGCEGGDKQGGEAAKQAIERGETISKEEDSLLARRDALVKARQRIRDERDSLDTQRRTALAAGGDTAEIDTKVRKLIAEEGGLLDEEEGLNKRYKEIIRQRREMLDLLATSGGGGEAAGGAAAVAGREKSIASREKGLSDHAAKLAEREEKLALREAAFAKREAQMCGIAAAPATIIKTVDIKGSSYTKRDVEPLLKKARSYMSKKGIRRSDLPEPARDLEKEATKAMAEGDFGRARFAASQLVSTVKSIKINKAFIQAKIGRLNSAVNGKKLSSKVDKLFRQATENYGDGKFSSANKKLNKIYGLI